MQISINLLQYVTYTVHEHLAPLQNTFVKMGDNTDLDNCFYRSYKYGDLDYDWKLDSLFVNRFQCILR